MKKRDSNYFNLLIILTENVCKNMEFLRETLSTASKEIRKDHIQTLKESVNDFMVDKKILEARLYRDFLPPIEREDIYLLVEAIGKINEDLEDVFYYLTVIEQSSMEILTENGFIAATDILLMCCQQLKQVIEELAGFQKNEKFRQSLSALLDQKRAMKSNLRRELQGVYKKSCRSEKVIYLDKIASYLECIGHSCYYVAEVLQLITLKNT